MINARQTDPYKFFYNTGANEKESKREWTNAIPRPQRPDASKQSQIDLRNADLVQANLDMTDLRGADLSRANLSGASLKRANLQEADLSWADLRETDLSRADLRGADLRFANLGDASSLSPVLNWKAVQLWENCNIYGVYNAPTGFRQWAMACGAVEVWLPETGMVAIDASETKRSHAASSWNREKR